MIIATGVISMIQECSVERNSQNKQLNVTYSQGFPLCAYYNDMDRFVAKQVPWHWHEELELIYVVQGEVLVRVYQNEIILKQGDGLWINAAVLHQIEKIKQPAILYSFVFSHRFVSADEQSVFETKYMVPLLHAQTIPYVIFDHQNEEQVNQAKGIYEAYLICQEEAYGYEFVLREKITMILLYVLRHHPMTTSCESHMEDQEVLRLKLMMSYLKQHYMEALRLKDLALHANISEREVLRCFQEHLKESPMQVLMKYRIMKACEMLGTSEESISEIAGICGFCDASYFAKQFKRMLSMSPRAYRNMMK